MLKNVKKGDVVALVGFTGIRLSDVEITGATKKQLKALKKNGDEMIFDRETGIQTNTDEGKERYANKIMLLEDAPTNKPASPKKKSDKKKAEKEEVEAEEVDFEEDEDEDEDEDEEKPAKSKKKSAAKSKKKPAKAKKPEVVEEDEDEDDDDWEDDDEFEEI